jgi:hypothetical protein
MGANITGRSPKSIFPIFIVKDASDLFYSAKLRQFAQLHNPLTLFRTHLRKIQTNSPTTKAQTA